MQLYFRFMNSYFFGKNKFQDVQLFLLCPLRSFFCSTVKLDIKEVEREEKRQAQPSRVPQNGLFFFPFFRVSLRNPSPSGRFPGEMFRLMYTLKRRLFFIYRFFPKHHFQESNTCLQK